jgi:hypothetical protein
MSTETTTGPTTVAEHQIEVEGDVVATLATAREVADDWGATWPQEISDTGGAFLRLPAVAGLRRGTISGHLHAEPAHAGQLPVRTRLRFVATEENYVLQRVPLSLLLGAALGCLIVLLWPFIPALAPLIPLAILLGFAAWFLVITKLSNAGPADFLEEIAHRAGRPAES